MAGAANAGRQGTPMLTVVADGCPGDGGVAAGKVSLIDEIVREGARRMLAEALRAEVDAYVASSRPSEARTAGAWWSATGTTSRGRC
jgi:hypothetical protein